MEKSRLAFIFGVRAENCRRTRLRSLWAMATVATAAISGSSYCEIVAGIAVLMSQSSWWLTSQSRYCVGCLWLIRRKQLASVDSDQLPPSLCVERCVCSMFQPDIRFLCFHLVEGKGGISRIQGSRVKQLPIVAATSRLAPPYGDRVVP